jgi:hypothetical protein
MASWGLGLDNVKGPTASEPAASGEGLYYGNPQNGTRRQWGIAPANGRPTPLTYTPETGIGGRLPSQPVLNGATREPWHQALNGTTSRIPAASPNGFTAPISPTQFTSIMPPEGNGIG